MRKRLLALTLAFLSAPSFSQGDVLSLQKISVNAEPTGLEADFDLQLALDEYIGEPLTEKTIQLLKSVIATYYKQMHDLAVAVVLPDQDVSDGELELVIIRPKISKVEFMGQKWISSKFLQNQVDATPGEPLDEDSLLNSIAWLNNNPFHQSEVVLAPGASEGSTTVEVQTKDRFPVRLYAGADNTGIESCNQVRLYGGMAWGDAFWIGDLLTYQYTASPDCHQFQSHLAQYTAYLPWQHILNTYANYSTIFPDISGFTSSGKAAQLSMRYLIPFKPFYRSLKQQISAGFDFKYLNNVLFYVAETTTIPVMNHSTNLSQLCFSYSWQDRYPLNQLALKAELYASLWKNWFPNQSNQAYEDLRFHSHVRYVYGRLSFRHLIEMPLKMNFTWLARFQLANSTLPVSEQFALGGYDTVRGYQERPFLADDAICLNLEFHSPPVKGFVFLAFWDYGWGYNYYVTAPNQRFQWLMGTGPGVRYDYYPYLSIRADYGFQLHDIPYDTHFGRFHLGITASY